MMASTIDFSISNRETSNCADRSTSGLICNTCSMIATCVRVNGVWLTEPVERCDTDAGMFCNLDAQGCSNATGPCHPFGYEGNFSCLSEGVFPDPYDCQRYHMCYRAGNIIVPANIDCGGIRAFSAATGDCSLTTKDSVCSKRQYNCTRPGESGAWPGNKNIFFICKATLDNGERILYPTLYRCAPGEKFEVDECVPIDSTPSTGITTTFTTNTEKFMCKTPGLHVNPSDCNRTSIVIR